MAIPLDNIDAKEWPEPPKADADMGSAGGGGLPRESEVAPEGPWGGSVHAPRISQPRVSQSQLWTGGWAGDRLPPADSRTSYLDNSNRGSFILPRRGDDAARGSLSSLRAPPRAALAGLSPAQSRPLPRRVTSAAGAHRELMVVPGEEDPAEGEEEEEEKDQGKSNEGAAAPPQQQRRDGARRSSGRPGAGKKK